MIPSSLTNSLPTIAIQTIESIPDTWAVFEVHVEEYEFKKVLEFFRHRRPRFKLRICGDREELMRSNLRRGSLGYFYVHDPYGSYDIPENFYGRFLRDRVRKNRPLLLSRSEVVQCSFTVDEIWQVELLNKPVVIISGDFRKLKGVVTAEYYDNLKFPSVDVQIQTMTLTRIINVSKRIVHPLNVGLDDEEDEE